MTRVLFLTKYTQRAAVSRYRVHQYLPFLKAAGFHCHIEPLFSDRYLDCIYSGSKRWTKGLKSGLLAIGGLAHRTELLLRGVSDYDLVYLAGYESLPYLPFRMEQWLFSGDTPVLVDCDDPIYLNYAQHSNPIIRRLLKNKIPKILKSSHHVIAANQHIAHWIKVFNPRVTVIPTSVDLRKYPVHCRTKPTNTRTIIGWIGTPLTARYLSLLAAPLQELQAHHDFVLKVIGAPDFEMKGVDVVGIPWSESTEFSELFSCDIGVMPLPANAWARGKSALKLIQYLAAETAGVASPVGANRDLIRDGVNGYLAKTDQEWVEKLSLLIKYPDLRKRLANNGRETVESQYSVQANAPLWVRIIREAIE